MIREDGKLDLLGKDIPNGRVFTESKDLLFCGEMVI